MADRIPEILEELEWAYSSYLEDIADGAFDPPHVALFDAIGKSSVDRNALTVVIGEERYRITVSKVVD